ncbi:hypothetical protein KC331_g14398 [Hortaea werneckii]|nr:hypothetical protein KC331_g14398 [Hortaea werneckii]
MGLRHLLAFTVAATALNPGPSVDNESHLDYGTFDRPSKHMQPRFRYVIPESSVDPDDFVADIKDIAGVGSGGIELIGFPQGVAPPIDWTKYPWGGEVWKNLVKSGLRAIKDVGGIMDLMIGPFNGGGVPAPYDDPGVMWDLLSYNISVPIGENFSGQLPGWGSGELVAATTGLVTEQQSVNLSASPSYNGPYYYDGTRYTMSEKSLRDVTNRVYPNGTLTLDLASDVSGIEHQVFAFYQVRSRFYQFPPPEKLATVPQSPITSFVQNGSWAADHFSKAGAEMITRFWDTQLIDDEMRGLLREVGNYMWEDSYEFGAGVHVWWTPDLLKAFVQSRGYDFAKYLPLIFSENAEFNALLASINQYFLDSAGSGQAYVADYRRTLTDLNAIYLRTLRQWANSLDMQFSAQVGYNLPLDMLTLIPEVDAPETESLGFSDNIDAYRQYAGPANLAGKRVISNELGAVSGEAYSQTVPEVLWHVKRAFAGNINNMILHLYPWARDYHNTTWPGYTDFVYMYSSSFGPRQPGWEFAHDWIDWVGRMTYIMQSGVPKVDLAFWLEKDSFESQPTQYGQLDLVASGYTYEYLSAENLDLPSAVVQSKILAPDRQAFKALIVRGNDTLTVAGADRLAQVARKGLPIVFSGGLPNNFSGASSSAEKTSALDCLRAILGLSNVHQVPFEGLAASLRKLGIEPRTKIVSDRLWYPNWRQDEVSEKTYVVIYNDAEGLPLGTGSSTGTVTVQASGTPYFYDPWTGAICPVKQYAHIEQGISFNLSLRGNESVAIAIHEEGRVLNDNERTAHVRCFDQPSSDNSHTVNLTDWNLTVDAWLPPENLTSLPLSKARRLNLTFNISELQPWSAISDSLRNVSGRGHYQSGFNWTFEGPTTLDLTALNDLSRAWLNGHQLPALDPSHPVVEITDYLILGRNQIEIVVTTTLANSLRPVWDDLLSGAVGPFAAMPSMQEYGLQLPVYVRSHSKANGGCSLL